MCGTPLPWWKEEMEKDKEKEQDKNTPATTPDKWRNVINQILKAHIKTKRSPIVILPDFFFYITKQTNLI